MSYLRIGSVAAEVRSLVLDAGGNAPCQIVFDAAQEDVSLP